MKIFMVDPSNFTMPYNTALARSLTTEGADVHLFGRPLRMKESVETGPFAFHPFFYRRTEPKARQTSRYLKGIEHCHGLAEFINHVKVARPDIVHFQWTPLPLVDAFAIALLRRLTTVFVTLHDTEPFNGDPGSRIQLAAYSLPPRLANGVIVHRRASIDQWAARGVAKEKLLHIPHGALGAQCLRDAPRMGRGADKLVLVLFGKIRPYKGLSPLIDALAMLPESCRSKLKVIIAGEPLVSLEAIYKKIAAENLSGTIEFRPFYHSEQQINDLFASADAFLFPYLHIDASGVFFESLSFGKPVIASSIGCFRDIVDHGSTGLLSAAGDPRALSDNLRAFVNDEGLRLSLQHGAGTLSTAIASWEDIARATSAAYERARTRAEPLSGRKEVRNG
ncbi:MAG TPA: glycosyltransferase family 4 protein [Microvirga sp.]|jgi:glycosyltransferase involved in cell wall biosynthesis|nr:glycosyltransferase family 4 protein [Microvirga sp.]